MLSLNAFISMHSSAKRCGLDINSPFIPILIAGYKYPDVPLIKQSELEEILTQYSIEFRSDKFPSITNHCSFNALDRHLYEYIISGSNSKAVSDYMLLSIEIFNDYLDYLDSINPKIQLERELERYQ